LSCSAGSIVLATLLVQVLAAFSFPLALFPFINVLELFIVCFASQRKAKGDRLKQ